MKWRYEQAKEKLCLEFAMSRHRISEAPSSPSVVWESYHKSILVHRALRKTVINYINEGQLHTHSQKQNKHENKKLKAKNVIMERESHLR